MGKFQRSLIVISISNSNSVPWRLHLVEDVISWLTHFAKLFKKVAKVATVENIFFFFLDPYASHLVFLPIVKVSVFHDKSQGHWSMSDMAVCNRAKKIERGIVSKVLKGS